MSTGESGQKSVWRSGLSDEIAFWDKWFETEGLQWPENYRDRLNPDLPLQPHLIEHLQRVSDPEVSILEVGAGPLTTVGKRWAGRTVRIVAVDPLADEYDRIMARRGIVPPVRTTWCHGELLRERFQRNSFDLVWAINSLDHSYDPLRIMEQCLDVVKVGHDVFLSHNENEAENENYIGLHQWNFCTDKAGHFVLWNKRRRIDVTERVAAFARVTGETLNRGVNVTLHKLRDRTDGEVAASAAAAAGAGAASWGAGRFAPRAVVDRIYAAALGRFKKYLRV